MKTVEEEVEKYKRSEYQPLIPLPEFRRSGRAPVDMHHLILFNKESLEEEGVIVRYGNRWLSVSLNYIDGSGFTGRMQDG